MDQSQWRRFFGRDFFVRLCYWNAVNNLEKSDALGDGRNVKGLRWADPAAQKGTVRSKGGYYERSAGNQSQA
jgi:hypothetical protein